MHTLWKGSISFGLVNVPVKLHAATESKEYKFNYLHNECKQRIRYMKNCPHCEREVENDELIKGYEFEKDRYVILTAEDLAKIEQPMSRSIDILDFINLDEIDPVYYQKSYYLSPEDSAQKAYRLLSRSMTESGKVAIAKITMRSKQHFACLRPYGEGLMLETMYYPAEIRRLELSPSQNEPTEMELSMARQLIEQLTHPFEPEKYRDEAREMVEEMIQHKIAGESFEINQAPEQGKVLDLMEALRASIAQTEKVNGEKVERKEGTEDGREAIEGEEQKASLKPRKNKNSPAKGA